MPSNQMLVELYNNPVLPPPIQTCFFGWKIWFNPFIIFTFFRNIYFFCQIKNQCEQKVAFGFDLKVSIWPILNNWEGQIFVTSATFNIRYQKPIWKVVHFFVFSVHISRFWQLSVPAFVFSLFYLIDILRWFLWRKFDPFLILKQWNCGNWYIVFNSPVRVWRMPKAPRLFLGPTHSRYYNAIVAKIWELLQWGHKICLTISSTSIGPRFIKKLEK